MSNGLHKENKRMYNIWSKMRRRCFCKSDTCYNKYGAKGITVCNEWNESFEPFYNWSIQNGYTDELTLDRIDPYGNYEPTNCRWVSMIQQQRNRGNNIRIEHNGEIHTISEWCELMNFSYACAKSRYFRLLKTQDVVTFDDVFSKRNGYRSKRIGQYSLDGKLIKEWNKLADIEAAGFNRVCVERNCSGKIKKPRKYIWKYMD